MHFPWITCFPTPLFFLLLPDLLSEALQYSLSHGVWGALSGSPEADAVLLTPASPACHGHSAPGSPALAHMLCYSLGERLGLQ